MPLEGRERVATGEADGTRHSANLPVRPARSNKSGSSQRRRPLRAKAHRDRRDSAWAGVRQSPRRGWPPPRASGWRTPAPRRRAPRTGPSTRCRSPACACPSPSAAARSARSACRPNSQTPRGTGTRAPSRRRRTTCAPRPSCPSRASSRSPSTTTSPTSHQPSSMRVVVFNQADLV